MNYISQINAFWEKVSEDQRIRTSARAVYLALLQINNQCGWKIQFQAVYGQVLFMTGIANVQTYYSCLNELVDAGYLIWKKGPNQYQAATFEIVMLYEKTEVQVESKLKATSKQVESNFNIPKQENNKQINIPFSVFWDLYDKKVGEKSKLEKKWHQLTSNDRELIIKHIPSYKLAQPDKKYRKNPEGYLSKKVWQDELIETSLSGLNIKTNVLPKSIKPIINHQTA